MSREIIFPSLTSYQQETWNWLDESGWRNGGVAVIIACRQV